jgi:hypothetical protein
MSVSLLLKSKNADPETLVVIFYFFCILRTLGTVHFLPQCDIEKDYIMILKRSQLRSYPAAELYISQQEQEQEEGRGEREVLLCSASIEFGLRVGG